MAQSLRDQVGESARAEHLGNAFQILTIFGGSPGISAANYRVEDGTNRLDLSSFKVPISHTFKRIGNSHVSPYAEMTLGYLTGRQNESFTLANTGTTFADTRYQAFSGLGGVGLSLPVWTNTLFRPMLLIGYTRLRDETNFRGPAAPVVDAATRGILYNVVVNTLIMGGAFELTHERQLFSDIQFRARIRYNHFIAKSYEATSDALETNGTFGVVTGGTELKGPMDFSLFGRDMRWIAFTAGTWLTGGREREELGFGHFLEVGGGFELVDETIVKGIKGINLRASALVGNGVTGWAAGLSLSF